MILPDSGSISATSTKELRTGSDGELQSLNPIISKDSLRQDEAIGAPSASVLIALCEGFLRQTQKLSAYPSFDKLWLGLLHVLGFFLQAPHGFRHTVLENANSEKPQVRELYALVAAAEEFLGKVLQRMSFLGLFKEREGLWQVTSDALEVMSFQWEQ